MEDSSDDEVVLVAGRIVTVLVFACYLFVGSMILKLVFGEGYEEGWSTFAFGFIDS